MPKQNGYLRQRSKKPKRVYDEVPMFYSDFFSHLLKISLVEPKQLDPILFPYPLVFDPNVSCDYHAGELGHSTKKCQPFRDKVQYLIDSNTITFSPMHKLKSQ